jgi:hypothetical protein
MPVQITITGENAQEALREIGGLSAALVGAAPAADKPAKTTKTQSATKPIETKKEEPEKMETEDPDQGDDGEEIPDDVKLRAAASEAAGRAGKPAVKALLDKYKVANVTAVPANKRLKFLEELEDLS